MADDIGILEGAKYLFGEAKRVAKETHGKLVDVGVKVIEGSVEAAEDLGEFIEDTTDKVKDVFDDDSQVKPERRFNEQCFLIDNLEKIAISHTKQAYKNFVIVDGNDPALVTHTLVGKKEISSLFQITPAQVALLIPKIKITKVSYPKNNKEAVEQPLLFRDHTSPESIENITKNRRGRGDEVGIKNFSYELAGKNVAEGGIATAQLKIFFQNVDSLVHDATPPNASFKDLIIPEARFVDCKDTDEVEGCSDIPSNRIYNSKHFRIKIEAGWATPSDSTGILINKELRRAIEKSRTVLFMTLVKHDLDFKDDGSVLLTVNYQGAMEAALVDEKSDLFRTKASEQIKTRQCVINQKEERIKKLQKEVPNSEKKTVVTKEEKKEKNTLTSLKIKDKQEKYGKITNFLLYDAKMYFTDVDKQHVEGFTKRELGVIQENNLDVGIAQRAEVQLGRRKSDLKIQRINPKNRNQLLEKVITATRQSIDTIANPAASGNYFEEIKSFYGNLFNSERSITSKDKMDKNVSSIIEDNIEAQITPSHPDKRRINFFYFGDLLEYVIQETLIADTNGKKRTDIENMSVLIGPMIFKDPRNPNGQPKKINLADIPISINLFISWYLKNVVAPLREKYLFDTFLKDVINTLILPALGENCFTLGYNQQQTVSMTFFSAPGVGKKGVKQSPLKTNSKLDKNPATSLDNPNLDKKKENSPPSVKGYYPETTHQDIKDVFHFLYVYVSGIRTKKLTGKAEDNKKEGIYHLYPTAEGGLVKSIKFNKQDQPYVAEARATSDSDASKRLRDRYNANVRMIGNCLFRPGMYVYIDTSKFGLGSGMTKTPKVNDEKFVCKGNTKAKKKSKKSIANQLGLGGYYQVTKVNHNVGENDYETELQCNWIFSGDEEIKNPIQKMSDKSNLTLFKAKGVLRNK